MKLTKVIALPILLCMQFVTVSEVVRAGENDDLQSFCSKFPLNSKCEGYEATTTSTISLDNRSGQKAKCLFSGEEKGKKCKIDLTSDQVKVYFEIGKGLDVLDGDKNTKEVAIPMKAIKSLSYSEKSKIDVGAVLALGVWGLFAKKKRSTMAIRYEQEAQTSQKQDLFVIGRKKGRKIRQKLELQTGLAADILGID